MHLNIRIIFTFVCFAFCFDFSDDSTKIQTVGEIVVVHLSFTMKLHCLFLSHIDRRNLNSNTSEFVFDIRIRSPNKNKTKLRKYSCRVRNKTKWKCLRTEPTTLT